MRTITHRYNIDQKTPILLFLMCFFSLNVFFVFDSSAEKIAGKVKDVTMGQGFICAITENGKAYCQGNRANGQLGNPNPGCNDYVYCSDPVPVDSSKSFSTIKAKDHTVCALTADKRAVYCWGKNGETEEVVNSPREFYNENDQFTEFTVGSASTKYLLKGGNLTTPDLSTDISGGVCTPEWEETETISDDVTTNKIAASGAFVCFESDDKLYCRGCADQFYYEEATQINVPNSVKYPLKDIETDGNVICIVDDDGQLYCWGNSGANDVLLEGNNQVVNEDNAKLFNNFIREKHYEEYNIDPSSNYVTKVDSVSISDTHICAIYNENFLVCWGSNANKQLGDTNTTLKKVLKKGYTFVSVVSSNTCVISKAGVLSCFGSEYGSERKMSDNPAGENFQPYLIYDPVTGKNSGYLNNRKIISLAVSAGSACAVNEAHELYCWGDNTYGQLGIGNKISQSTPVRVDPSNSSYDSVKAGRYYNCARRTTDWRAYCWGKTDANAAEILYPSVFSGVNSRRKGYSVGDDHHCYYLNNLFCYGDHSKGQLGTGSTRAGGRIVDPGNIYDKGGKLEQKNTTKPYASHDVSCATTDGSYRLYCWGDGINVPKKVNFTQYFGEYLGAFSTMKISAYDVDNVNLKNNDLYVLVSNKLYKVSSQFSNVTRFSDSKIYDVSMGGSYEQSYFVDGGRRIRKFNQIMDSSVCTEGDKLCFYDSVPLVYKNIDLGDETLQPLYNVEQQAKIVSTHRDSDFACAVDINGRVSCWWHKNEVEEEYDGINRGQLGVGDDEKNLEPKPPVDYVYDPYCTEACCKDYLYKKIGTACTNGRTGKCAVTDGIYGCKDEKVICVNDQGEDIDKLSVPCCYDVDYEKNINQPCSGGLGICSFSGTYKCLSSDPFGVLSCYTETPPQEPTDEICRDRKDNDCDGAVDEVNCIRISDNICLFDDNFRLQKKLEGQGIKALSYYTTGTTNNGSLEQTILAAVKTESFKGVKQYKIADGEFSSGTNKIKFDEDDGDPIDVAYSNSSSSKHIGVLNSDGKITIFKDRNNQYFYYTRSSTSSNIAMDDEFFVVTNRGRNDISLKNYFSKALKLNFGGDLQTLNVGKSPRGVALYKSNGVHYAIVANSGDNTVSIVKLEAFLSRVVATINVERMPYDVAVTSNRKRAAVVNYFSDSISYISLENNSVITTLKTGRYPSKVIMADLDQNGLEDIVVTNENGSLSVHYQTENDHFRSMSNIALQAKPLSVLALQTSPKTSFTDGNNRLSLLVLDNQGDLNFYQHSKNTVCKKYCSNGRFSEYVNLSNDDKINDITFTDTGKLLATSASGIHVYTGSGNGNFSYSSMPQEGDFDLISGIGEEALLATDGQVMQSYDDVYQNAVSKASNVNGYITSFTKFDDSIWTVSEHNGIGRMMLSGDRRLITPISVIVPSSQVATVYKDLTVGSLYSEADIVYAEKDNVVVLKNGSVVDREVYRPKFFPHAVTVANVYSGSDNELILAEGCGDTLALDKSCPGSRSMCCEKENGAYKYSGFGRLAIYSKDNQNEPVREFRLNDVPSKIYKTDIDGDIDATEDLVVLTNKSLTIFYNFIDGADHILHGVTYPLSSRPVSLEIRDLNYDSMDDLIVLTTDNKINVYLQNPVNSPLYEDKEEAVRNYCVDEPSKAEQDPDTEWECKLASPPKDKGYCGCGSSDSATNLGEDNGNGIPDCVDEKSDEKRSVFIKNGTKPLPPFVSRVSGRATVHFERFKGAKRNKKTANFWYQVEVRSGDPAQYCSAFKNPRTTRVQKQATLSLGLAQKIKYCIRYRGVIHLSPENNPRKLPDQFSKWSAYTVFSHNGDNDKHIYAGGKAVKAASGNTIYRGTSDGTDQFDYQSEVLEFPRFLGYEK